MDVGDNGYGVDPRDHWVGGCVERVWAAEEVVAGCIGVAWYSWRGGVFVSRGLV